MLKLIGRWLLYSAMISALLLGGHGEVQLPALDALRRAEAHVLRGERSAAENAYREALQGLRAPDPALRLAHLYADWGRFQEARAWLNEARARGASREAVEELALPTLLALREWDEAYRLAQSHLQIHPQSHEAWAALTTALLAHESCEEARQQSAAWLEALPADEQAQRLWAVLHLQSDFGAARAILCEVDRSLCTPLQQCSMQDQCELRLGAQLVQQNDWALALCLLRPFGGTAPQNADGHAWIGAALIRGGHYAEGQRSLQRALQLNPDHPLAWTLLGLLQLQQADYAAAEASLFKAHQLDPGNPALCLALARLYALQSAYSKVDVWAGAALDRAGEDVEVWQSVARFYLERGQRGAVLERALRGCLEKAPRHPQTLLLHGWAALLEGDARTARGWLDQAVAEAPDLGEAWYLRGLARQRLGEDASEDFVRARDAGYFKP